MSKRFLWSAVAALLGGPAPVALAQAGYALPPTGPFSRPVTSPYLNLNRAGASPAINYYNLVRPEFREINTAQSLQLQVNQIRQQPTFQAEGRPELPATGYPVRFLDYGAYFAGAPGQAGVRPATPARPATTPPPAPGGTRR
jgi:hypothetical protein